jgi:DNA modification methylase
MTKTTTTTRSAPEGDLPVGTIHGGDARTQLGRLPGDSVDTVITSPPYYLLRDYGVRGQIGSEATVDGWVDGLLAVLEEIGRVLKPTGSVWLNLGDTYSRHYRFGAPPKSLLLGPERLMLALTRAGWSVRNKVVWAKPNPMPTSVRDRLSATWEPLYLLTPNSRYFFDLDAIRDTPRSKLSAPARLSPDAKYHAEAGHRPTWAGPLAGSNAGLEAMKRAGRSAHPLGKNPGDVWSVATASYRGAHFATFPEGLVRRPLLATCPQRVCRTCGTPWWPSDPVHALGHIVVEATLRKSCGCADRAWAPGVVLDPFMGSGTVAVVAERHGRRWVGIELKGEYRRLAWQRIRQARIARRGDDHGTAA